MKITLTLIALFTLTTVLNSATIPIKLKVDNCTVTSSSTRSFSGFDCDDNPLVITATGSCSEEATTCTEAYSLSQICAGLKAQNNLNGLLAYLPECW